MLRVGLLKEEFHWQTSERCCKAIQQPTWSLKIFFLGEIRHKLRAVSVGKVIGMSQGPRVPHHVGGIALASPSIPENLVEA